MIDTQLATQNSKTEAKKLEAQKVRAKIKVNEETAKAQITQIRGTANATGTGFASSA